MSFPVQGPEDRGSFWDYLLRATEEIRRQRAEDAIQSRIATKKAGTGFFGRGVRGDLSKGTDPVPRPPPPEPTAAPADATKASLGALLPREQPELDLEGAIQRAWDAATSPPEGSSGFALEEGIGPDLLNLLANAYNVAGAGDVGNIGPAAAAFKFFPTAVSRAAEGASSGAARQPVGNLVGRLFDIDAPGRGIPQVTARIFERPQAEGLEAVVEMITRQFADPKKANATLGALTKLAKQNPQLGQAIGEALQKHNLKVEEFIEQLYRASVPGSRTIPEIGQAISKAGGKAGLDITATRGAQHLGERAAKQRAINPGSGRSPTPTHRVDPKTGAKTRVTGKAKTAKQAPSLDELTQMSREELGKLAGKKSTDPNTLRQIALLLSKL